MLVKDINPGESSSGPSGFVDLNGTLFFTVFRPEIGHELWTSDGTESGTERFLGDFEGELPMALFTVRGSLFFQVGAALWSTDGTANGTTLVRDGILPSLSGFAACGGSFAEVKGTLVFPGKDDRGCELWTSDGATADILMDIYPGPANSMWPFSSPPFTVVGGLVLFGADNGPEGMELWATDGSNATGLVQDIAVGAGWSSPGSLTQVGQLVFFTADDHISGEELWAISRTALNNSMGAPQDSAFAAQAESVPARRASADEFRAFLPSTGESPEALAVR